MLRPITGIEYIFQKNVVKERGCEVSNKKLTPKKQLNYQ